MQIVIGTKSPTYQGASRALLEYQFLPEKPSAINDPYERVAPHYYGSPSDVLNSRVPLPTGRPMIRSNEQGASGYLQGQMPSLSLLPQQVRHEAHSSPAPGEVDLGPLTAPVVNANIDSQLFVHPGNGFDNQITTPERRAVLDPERLERKRKVLFYIVIGFYTFLSVIILFHWRVEMQY